MKDLSHLLYDTWCFFKKHWLGMSIVIAPFIIPLNMAYVALEFLTQEETAPSQLYWLTLAVGVASYPFYQGALIIYLASLITANPTPLAQCYQLAVRFWPALMLLYLLRTIAMAFGFAILFFPGFIIMARIAFAEFYCLFDDQQPANAFSNSWKNTKTYQWPLLKGLTIILAATTLPFWGIEYLLHQINLWNPLFSFLLGLANAIFSTLATVFTFRVYTISKESTPHKLNISL